MNATPNFTQLNRVLPSCTWFALVLPSLTGSNRVLPSFLYRFLGRRDQRDGGLGFAREIQPVGDVVPGADARSGPGPAARRPRPPPAAGDFIFHRVLPSFT